MRTRALLILIAAAFDLGCAANESVLRSGRETQANAPAEKTSFVADLESMRTAKFSFIIELRRRDGREIDAEDRSVIKIHTASANRRVSTDDGRAFLIGSNDQLPPDSMKALGERFALADHSPPPVDSTAIPPK